MTKITIEEFLQQDYSPQTVKSYMFAINHFLKLNRKAKRYKYKNIVEYMEEISQQQPNAKYRVVILSAIKKYYDYLVMSGYRADHPCKKLNIKVNSNQAVQVQDLFSSEELQLLLNRENRYENLDTRNSVLLSLLIYQGLTSDEIIRLNVKDIDLDSGTVYIKSSANLNNRRLQLLAKQILLFSKYISEVRPRMLRSSTDKLIITKLGKPIAVNSIHAMIEPLKPLFPDKSLNPKTIRMSVICNWLNEKELPLEQVQELAGHKWPGTTEKYFKADSQQQRELINRYFPL
ncbi:tyrosine-type recombinase/integrase [Flavobacterium johnsoniae]|uniref:Phage integrase family protein n=1 Tax=Flavobacterium johnsoniae (strain ATCC 17061 / DSM 2064 / JCM 8514 / BCRC 14874 / CCUG 350202 / NBRC 14942 / NCIMB 11054 / UW101) TaxID=376686 RepID=A5FDJ9_FLAJ1|nr:site-specific integrase [Flavobacterium johnsoniae]ABQ06713.1 phage integrase family protein [Flavobacterium johnsoniae UW101]OXE95260.1 integrase [Flavobacterium johnsoniae UW101]WQG82471.1 site-specific integrase [Flavobacterium johnsoniae UW101]SHM02332.1 Site-specific recombinase XerD [Flavobacterium johnsoniae]